MDMDSFCSKFADLLATLPSKNEVVAVAARTLAQGFSTDENEVAIYTCDDQRESLSFVWPSRMQSAGSVPLNAHNSLVAKTAVEKKSYLDNSFATTPHLFIFERFRLDITGGVPIQKIISAPLLAGDDVKGVIQVCRKGNSKETAGADFTPAQEATLVKLASIIAPYL